MLYENSQKMFPVLADDLLLNSITPVYRDVDEQKCLWLLDYTIFDMGARSLSELDAMTAGKYLCLMQSRLRAHLASPATGTATAGGASTITLAVGASGDDDYYNGMVIEITAGTRSGQFRVITDYVGSTRVATVGTAWTGGATDNTSVYRIGGEDTIVAADVSPHTAVVVTGIKIDAYNRLQSFMNDVRIKISANQDYTSKLTLSFGLIKFIGTATIDAKNITITNTTLYFSGSGDSNGYLVDCPVNNSTIYMTGSFVATGKNGVITNSILYVYDVLSVGTPNIGIQTNSTYTYLLSNLYVYSASNSNGLVFAIGNPAGYINCIKLFLDNCRFYCSSASGYVAKSSSISYIDYYNINVASNTIGNYNLRPAAFSMNDYIVAVNGRQTVDWTKIDWANSFITVDGKFSCQWMPGVSTGNVGKEIMYNLQFAQTNWQQAAFKRFNESYLFVVKREDIEATLAPASPKKIKNLLLYENDGTTLYEFAHDEYFLITAKDASNNVVVLAWYGKRLENTTLSDYYPDTTYTIEHCFQLWVPKLGDSIAQRFPYNTDAGVNSPLSGGLDFDNLDREIVDRR